MTTNQFSLRAMFAATAIIAGACWLTVRLLADGDPRGGLLALVAVPIIMGAAVGVIRRDKAWVGYAVGAVIVIMAAMLVWLFATGEP